LYDSLNIIRVIKIKDNEMGEACSTHGRDEKCVLNFDRKSEGLRPHGRYRRR